MKEKTLRLILGNQLFPLDFQNFLENKTVFMCEDSGLCTYEKHHKSKIALFFMTFSSHFSPKKRSQNHSKNDKRSMSK